jgi:hypothetical protein
MPSEFQVVFSRLREILRKNKKGFEVTEDSATRYCLAGTPGSETLKAWKGKTRRPEIPVAWVQIGKAYVSYHLMGIYMNAALHKQISKPLKLRMQGKSCFNFKANDEELFKEVDSLTSRSLDVFRLGNYVRSK